MSADGWPARVLSWALAILATLAIVGAVATMSTNTMPGGAARSERGEPAMQAAAMRDDVPPSGRADVPFTTGAPRVPAPPTPAMRQADDLRDVAGWLEALTYAVLALVAVAAVGVLALFRLGRR